MKKSNILGLILIGLVGSILPTAVGSFASTFTEPYADDISNYEIVKTSGSGRQVNYRVDYMEENT
jgi:hypothetical protein